MIMPKTKPHIFVLLAFLLCAGMIVSPVCANTIATQGYFNNAIIEVEQDHLTNFLFTCNSSRAISLIQFQAPKYTELNYTITYGDGGTLSGYMSYEDGSIPIVTGIVTINIGSSSDSRSFVDTGLLRKWELVGYARELDDNGTAISHGYAITDVSALGQFQTGFIAYQSVAAQEPLESFSFTSNTPVWLQISTAEREDIADENAKNWVQIFWEWIDYGISITPEVFAFVFMIFGIIRFFFIDNIVLTLALYLSVTMAYSAISSVTTRGFDIFRFYKKFIGLQRALLNFVMEIWNYLIQIIASFRGIFRL